MYHMWYTPLIIQSVISVINTWTKNLLYHIWHIPCYPWTIPFALQAVTEPQVVWPKMAASSKQWQVVAIVKQLCFEEVLVGFPGISLLIFWNRCCITWMILWVLKIEHFSLFYHRFKCLYHIWYYRPSLLR